MCGQNLITARNKKKIASYSCLLYCFFPGGQMLLTNSGGWGMASAPLSQRSSVHRPHHRRGVGAGPDGWCRWPAKCAAQWGASGGLEVGGKLEGAGLKRQTAVSSTGALFSADPVVFSCKHPQSPLLCRLVCVRTERWEISTLTATSTQLIVSHFLEQWGWHWRLARSPNESAEDSCESAE